MMSKCFCILSAMVVWLFAHPVRGQAPTNTPLAELLSAAEEQADLFPEDKHQPRKNDLLVPQGHAKTDSAESKKVDSSNANGNDRAQTPKKERTEIREAIWSAVSEEVSREVMGRTRPNDGIGIGKGKGNNSPSDDQGEQKGKSEAARLKQAALQSQQARQNQMASEARKNAKAQGNKLLIPLGTVVQGRTGVPR